MKIKYILRLTAICIVLMLTVTALGETDASSESGQDAEAVVTEVETTLATTPTDESAQEEEQDAVVDEAIASEPPDDNSAAQQETNSDESSAEKIIVSITPISQSECEVSQKPTLSEVVAALPSTLNVTLSDGTTDKVAITWTCSNYDDDAASYTFQSVLNESGYVLSDGVSMPTAVLYITGNVVSGDFTFTINDDDTLTLIAWDGTASSAAVPDAVDGRSVIAVAASAFAGNTSVRTIILPEGLITLESGAFRSCTKLETVELPDTLEEVGTNLFSGCDALETIQIDIYLETTFTDGTGYTRTVQDEDQQERRITVSFGETITDYCVLSGGIWIQDGDIEIKADHAATVNSGGKVSISESSAITVLGTLSCSGTCENSGTIIACAGSVSGMSGTIVTEHSYSNGFCTVCGEQQQSSDAIVLTIVPNEKPFEKTYDGQGGIALSTDDFTLTGIEDGDDVYIAAINMNFTESQVGSYLTAATFELGGEDAEKYTTKTVEISITIVAKQVTVTPTSGQSKTYGSSDPPLRATYRGLISGAALSGSLYRAKGEDVGTYKITVGTLEKLNPFYEIVLASETFSITAKSISASDITVARVANQRYTGDALTPGVEVTDGSATLTEGTDYTLSYSDNTSVGTATITITGKGNYTGSRTITFRIIKVTSSSGSSSASFDDETDTEDTDSEDTSSSESTEGHLILNDTDYGLVLVDAYEEPLDFETSQRKVMDGDSVRTILCLTVSEDDSDEWYDADAEEDAVEPRLCLTMAQIAALQTQGYTDVELQVGEAELRVPLSTLYSEYEDEAAVYTV